MKKVIVLNQESVYNSIELYEYTKENQIEDVLSFFDDNADKISIDSDVILFIDIETEGSVFVIYLDTEYKVDKNKLEAILTKFFSPDFKNYFDKKVSVWSEFKDNCIAYRKGEGYTYTIWQYNE